MTGNGYTLTTIEPDHPTMQRAYSETTSDVVGDDEVVLDITRGPINARIVMPFLNLGQGIPHAMAALLADEQS